MGGVDLGFLTLSLGTTQEHDLPPLVLAGHVAGLAELRGQFASPSTLGGELRASLPCRMRLHHHLLVSGIEVWFSPTLPSSTPHLVGTEDEPAIVITPYPLRCSARKTTRGHHVREDNPLT